MPVIEALKSAGAAFEVHHDHFTPGATDQEWLPLAGSNRWIVLTKDKRIRYNELEVRSLVRFRVRQFCFSSGNLSGREMGEILSAQLRGMQRFCKKNPGPFVATITKSGSINLRYPKRGKNP